MASNDKDKLLEQGLQDLEDGEENEALRQVAKDIDDPQIQDGIHARYLDYGKQLLSDDIPGKLDPRILRRLKPILGDVSNVRVHSGKVATEAARAMQARAFAIGDRDVFIDAGHLAPGTPEGAALLAHEVAHTKDPGAHFALSGAGGSSAEHEARAERIEERVFALEDSGTPPENASEADGTDAHTGHDASAPSEGRQADPAALDAVARTVVDLLKQADMRYRERHGR